MKQLTRDEMKKVMGGLVACGSCTRICCSQSDGYSWGACSGSGSNYCCASSNTYWCVK